MKIQEIKNGTLVTTERGEIKISNEIADIISVAIEKSDLASKNKETIYLDLSKYLVKGSRMLIGHDEGESANLDLRLDYHVLTGCNIEIKVPENVITMGCGFLDNLIYYAACYLGSLEIFNSRIKFITNIYEFEKDLAETVGRCLRNPDFSIYALEFGYKETDFDYMQLHDKAMYLYEEGLVIEKLKKDNYLELYSEALEFEIECVRKLERDNNFSINLLLYYCASLCAMAFRIKKWTHVFYYANKALRATEIESNSSMIDFNLVIELEEVKCDSYQELIKSNYEVI